MKNFCLNEGTMQAFLDGELAAEKSLRVSAHIAVCDACANALAAAEEETSFAFSAIENEFNSLVPTRRLWTKINDSIVEEKKSRSFWQKFSRCISVAFANPSLAIAAGILIFVGIFAIVLIKNPFAGEQLIAANQTKTINNAAVDANDQKRSEISASTAAKSAAVENSTNVSTAEVRQEKRQTVAVKTSSPNRPKSAENETETKKNENLPPNNNFQPPKIENAAYLPGEESYVKTISSLTQTVNGQKNEVLKPSAQISFERDLAVVNDAITRLKTEIRKNPKNEAARQVLYSSYQNKIDLLNSVAEKNELMASLK